MMTLRHITAPEVRHQQKREREREREIEIERERERERELKTRKRWKGTLTKMEKETGISSMIGFDTKKKLKGAKLKEGFQLRDEKSSKPTFVSKDPSINPSPRFEKFCWPVIVVKLRKGQKILKNF